MKGCEVWLLLQDSCAQETPQKGNGLSLLCLQGEGDTLLTVLAEHKLWS